MESEYKIVYAGGEAQIIEKKSRFIATVVPVETEEEALAFIGMQLTTVMHMWWGREMRSSAAATTGNLPGRRAAL